MPEFLRCRLCAEFRTNNTLISINNKAAQTLNLRSKIKDCFDLDFQDASLPKNVCLSCCEKVDIFFGFKEQVRKAQKVLKSAKVSEKNSTIKEDISDFNVEPLDYVESVLSDDIKVKESPQESSCKSNVDKSQKKNESDKSNISKKPTQETEETDVTKSKGDTSKSKTITWKTPKRSELDPELAIDSAERSEIIIRVKEAWKSYKWKCCLCTDILSSVEDLRTHFADVHNKNPQYSCMECSKVFESYFRFRLHHKKHRSDYNYRCSICSKFFYLKKHYETHLEKHDPKNKKVKKRYDCTLCGKRYQCSSSLRTHLSIHDGKPKHKCETCGKLFLAKYSLMKHQKLHSEGPKIMYTCEKCGRSFANLSSLKYHMESTHTDGKPYWCPQCQRTFKTAAVLRAHVATHSTEKKYACEICGKRFRTKGLLTGHLIIHTDNLPFECEYCHKRYRTKIRLRVHIRQHTGERPYYCEECNLSFSDSSNCLKHMKTKHNVHTVRKNVTYRTVPSTSLPNQELINPSGESAN